jgi:chromosome segregation ATPase
MMKSFSANRVVTMASQTIATASQQSESAIQLTAAVRAGRRGVVFRREHESIDRAPVCRLTRSKTVERSRVAGRVSARAYAAAGAWILCLFIGAIEDGRCDEGQDPAFTATTAMGYKLPEPYVIRKRSGLVTQVAEITPIEPKRRFERARREITNLVAQLTPVPQSDAGDGKMAHASQSVPDRERRQALEREQEWGRAEALARALVSKVRAEFDAARSTTEAAADKQPRALTAETLTRELTTLQSELETARAISREAIQASEAGIKLTHALEQERQRADDLARELASVRAKLETARAPAAAGPEAAQAAPAITEQELRQQRGKVDALALDLASARAEIDAARIAGSEAKQAIAEASAQKQAVERELEQQQNMAERLARDLTSARAEIDAARIAGSEAKLAIAEASAQKQAVERELEQQQNTAERLALDLASARAEIDAARIAGSEAKQAIAEASAQKQAVERELEQQQNTAERLARDLASLRTEHETAQTLGSEAARAAAAMVDQKRAVEHELEQQRDKAEILARELASARAELDTARLAGSDAAQAAAAGAEQNQALERELKQQRDRAGAIAGELTSLRAELDAARAAVSPPTVRIVEVTREQTQASEEARNRIEMLTRELAAVRTQADERSARLAAAYAEVLQVTETSRASVSEQKIALAAERDRADAGARELASVRDQLESYVRSDATNAAVVEFEQRQALEKELKQQRDGAETLARELALVRTELDNAHGVAQEAARSVEATKIEHEQALKKERDRAETLARELASARMQADERSTRLAAAYAEVLQVADASRVSASEQKIALAAERDRADAGARELASVRDQLDAGNRQPAALKAFRAPAAVDGLPEWVATSRSMTTEGTFHHPQQASMQVAAFYQEPSSPPEAKPPAAQSAAPVREPVLESNAAAASAPSAPARTLSRSLVDERRLLARAIALLREADISGARPLLEHAAQRGSARAAFMLAETYDDRVLLSWRVRGIAGDIAKALELYELAQSGGIEDAKERIKKLQQLSVRSSPTQGR